MSSEDSFHCTSQVVIAKLFEYPAKVSDRPLVRFQKGLPAGMWESTLEGSSTGHAPHAKHAGVLSFAGNVCASSPPTSDGLQAELFHIPTHGHLFSGGSVHTLVGHGRNPLAQLRIHVRETMRLASLQPAKEVPPQVLHSGFDLALGLRSIRPAQLRREDPVARKIQKHRMPDDLATLITSQPHRLHPVVENLFGNTTRLPKRFSVHPQRADLLVQRHFRHHASAVAHREGERPQLLLLAFALQRY